MNPRLALLVCLFAAPGCAYMQDRGKDFGEIWKADLDVGVGLRVGARFGDLVHTEAGFAFAPRFGWAYGVPESLLAHVEGGLVIVHAEDVMGTCTDERTNWQTPLCHGCVGILPVASNRRIRSWLHRFDVEFGANVILVGFEFGFSPGELLDFIVGFFGVDLDPDPASRGDDSTKPGIPSPFYPEEKKPEAPQKAAPE